MTVRILTSTLLGLLVDLLQTADPAPDAGPLGAVLLHTTRGHHGAEPGALDLLAGASTDRSTAGHTYAPCAGQLGAPTLWTVRDTRNVVAVFKAARGRDPQNAHAVEITRSPGEMVIREDPNLIDEGVSLAFGELDAGEFPAPTLYRILAPRPRSAVLGAVDGRLDVVDPTPRTDIPPARLRGFSAVARRRGEVLRVYRTHQHAPLLVQIGEAYRGVLLPRRPVDGVVDGDQAAPDAELHPPRLDDPRWRRGPEQDDERRPVEWQQLYLEERNL